MTPSELHNKMAAGFVHSVGSGCNTYSEVMVVLESIILGCMLLNVKVHGLSPQVASVMVEEAVNAAMQRFTEQMK